MLQTHTCNLSTVKSQYDFIYMRNKACCYKEGRVDSGNNSVQEMELEFNNNDRKQSWNQTVITGGGIYSVYCS